MATIASGVGANSAIFSVIDAVMLRPLPFRDADRVILINERTPLSSCSRKSRGPRSARRRASAARSRSGELQKADVFLPIGPFIAAQPADRGWHPGIQPIARLDDGVSIDQANTEVAGIAARLEKAFPDTNTRTTMSVTRAQDAMIQGVRTALLVLLAAVAGVLLIACINVAGLLLARGLSRRRDLAVRLALGASRVRIVVHLLAESVILSIAGGALGLLLAAFFVPALLALVGSVLPRADMVAVDYRVVVFTFVLSLVTAVVFGLVPALQSSRVDVREALNEAGRSGMGGGVWQRRARAGLVIVVRIALGASPRTVLALVLRQGLALSLAGVGIGLAASVAAVRALNTVLFDISPWDPIAWVVSAGTLLAVSLLASWVPARRALRVDPVVALRA